MNKKDSELPEFLAAAQKSLIHDLDETFSALSLVDIGIVAEAAEFRIQRHIGELLTSRASFFVAGAESVEGQVGSVRCRSLFYDVVVTTDVFDTSELIVAYILRSAHSERAETLREQQSVNGAGSIEHVCLALPEGLPAHIDRIIALVTSVLETGYRWITETAMTAISDQSIAASGLYSYLHTVIADTNIQENLWLSAIRRDYGVYLLDRSLVDSAVRRAKDARSGLGMSPFRIVSELWTALIPYDLLDAKRAIDAEKCLDVSTATAPYKDTESTLALAEEAVFGTDAYSICPVCQVGETHLCAAFPTKMRVPVEIILQHHRDALSLRFEAFQKRLRKLARVLLRPPRTFAPTSAGEFTGSAVASFLKTFYS